MKKVFAFGIILSLYFTYGLFLANYDLSIIKYRLKPEHPGGYYDYKGVTHCHTVKSGGSGNPSQVIAAAQESHLDFLFFTDLNDFDQNYELEGYHDHVLVSVAGEYSFLDSRILYYDRNKDIKLDGLGQAQVFFADLVSQDSKIKDLMWMSHPLKPGHTWSGNYPTSLDGIEVINLKTVWQKAWPKNRLSFFWSFLTFPFNSRLSLIRLYEDPKEEVGLWDKLNQQTRTAGFVGNDTTARALRVLGTKFHFPSYTASFDIASNHILLKSELTGDADKDRTKIVEALKAGQFYMSLDILADPKGFYAEIRDEAGNRYPLGSEIKWQQDLQLHVRLPQKPEVPFEIAAYKDGKHIMSSNSRDTIVDIHSSGVYRILVRVIPTFPLPDGKKWIPWIYSNPFYIKE